MHMYMFEMSGAKIFCKMHMGFVKKKVVQIIFFVKALHLTHVTLLLIYKLTTK